MSQALPDPAAQRRDVVLLVLVGVALVIVTAVGPFLNVRYGGVAHWVIFALTAAGAIWATFACDRLEARTALVIIALVAIIMRLPQLGIEPYLSDDIYRYVWDGRVQAAGINPYRYVPAAPELAALRDAAIFPKINRADYAPTIYPPAAQIFFFAVTRLGESVLVMKLAMVVCEALAIGATLIILSRLGLPATRITAFAWHPLPVWEIAGSGHIDALMVALLMAAVVLFLNKRTLAAGVMATVAALVKPTALLALPVFWRPWRLALPAVVIATGVLLYLPYLSVGWKVLGFLPGYVAEEGLNRGLGFRLVMILERVAGEIPGSGLVYASLFGIVMLVLAFRVSFRQDRSPDASIGALAILITVFLVLLTPHYPWYYLALIPFVAIYPWSWTLWVLTVAGVETYDEIPGDVLPDYVLRQVVFNALVLLALARDILRLSRAPAQQSIGAMAP
jgi:hypothetical protein